MVGDDDAPRHVGVEPAVTVDHPGALERHAAGPLDGIVAPHCQFGDIDLDRVGLGGGDAGGGDAGGSGAGALPVDATASPGLFSLALR